MWNPSTVAHVCNACWGWSERVHWPAGTHSQWAPNSLRDLVSKTNMESNTEEHLVPSMTSTHPNMGEHTVCFCMCTCTHMYTDSPHVTPFTISNVTEGVLPMHFSLYLHSTRIRKLNLSAHKLPSTKYAALGTEANYNKYENTYMKVGTWKSLCEQWKRKQCCIYCVYTTTTDTQDHWHAQDRRGEERRVLPCWAEVKHRNCSIKGPN